MQMEGRGCPAALTAAALRLTLARARFMPAPIHACAPGCCSDLKPENFLLGSHDPQSVLKVTDFGLSCR
jgi:hypothetical protein